MTTRRQFLQTSALLGFGASVPTFLGKTAWATPTAERPSAAESILVLIQLTGGNDGLNTVIPRKDPEYYRLRPTLAIAKDQQRSLSDEVALHPALAEIGKLYDEQQMTIVQSVGYPNPSQSHFRSMDIWQAGHLRETITDGWLGRAQRQSATAAFHIGPESSPLALAGAPTKAPSLTSLEDFQRKFLAASRQDYLEQDRITRASVAAGSPSNPLLDFVQRTAMTTYQAADKLRGLDRNRQKPVTYPAHDLAQRLQLVAQLIDSGLGARLYYVTQDGFDTHSGQGGRLGAHANLLTRFSESVAAFQRDLTARGQEKRVVVLAFSEFGRRGYENGSGGTDHGAAAPVLLFGSALRGGVHGPAPDLTELSDGNIRHAIDFRRIYAALLEHWLKVPAATVLGEGFEPFPLFR